MPENLFIQKRKKARNKPFLTSRVIFSLILLSLLIYAGFYFEFGRVGDALCDGPCESTHSFGVWLAGGGILLASIIGLAFIVGVLVALIRRTQKSNDTLSTLLANDVSKEAKTNTGTSKND